jgi:hypothetical protein
LIRRIVLRLALSAILVLAFAVPAFAQGQVERGPEHARSICSFSGLNDGFPKEEDVRVQNYGHEKKLHPASPSPGFACNPEKGPFEGPFGEEPLP